MTVTILPHPTHLCFVKQAWADTWVERSLLEGLSISDQAAPGHSSARLKYDYGRGMAPAVGIRAADTTPTTIGRSDLTGWYIRIDVTGLGSWYGLIQDKDDARDALWAGSVPSGCEQYAAFGLTWLLDQQPILQSKVKYSGGTWVIDRTIPFNGGTDGRAEGNRVRSFNYDATNKCFTDIGQAIAPTCWKAKDAVEYVLANFAPKNQAGSVLVPFSLHASALTFLDYEIPLVEYDGLTPWALINKLIDRRRGLGWHAIINAGTVQLVVWSQNAASLSLPSGSSVPANPNLRTYDFDNALNIQNAAVATTLMSRYDQVVVRGERAGSVFTVRPETNFEPDWTSTQKTTYNTAASAATGYSSLSDEDKAAANADRRAADDLDRVYSWWKPAAAWNGRSDTDPTSGSAPYALPKISADGVVDLAAAANIQRAGLRVEQYLPLRQGVDYTAAITPAIADTDAAEADFLPPIFLFQIDAIRSSGDAGWVHCERLGQALDTGSSLRPYSYSVALGVRDDAPGFVLRVNGKPQHYIAQDEFLGNGEFEDISPSEGIDHDSWLATIYMLQDQCCRAQYPLDADLPSLDLVRRLYLRVPQAYLDYVVPGTIVGVVSGSLTKSTSGGYVRDDRPRLQDVARLAFAWYGTTRRILNLSFKGIASGFSVGDLITSIGAGAYSETINTCITSVSYDLHGGGMQLHTQFGELDFTA